MTEQRPGSTAPAETGGRVDLRVSPEDAGSRVDRVLGAAFAPDYSRSYLAALVSEGAIRVDGKRVRPSFRVVEGARIEGELGARPSATPTPEPMDLTILHEDPDLIVIDKSADLVVHPGNGRTSGTLANGLLHRYPELATVGRSDRPGIVHRLDRDTTGVMAIARSNAAASSLVNQFKRKLVEKEYAAIVWGEMPFDSDWIDLPIGPHARKPLMRSIVESGGQSASTFYRVSRRLGRITYVHVFPSTGRTHQIRVHLDHVGFPVVADHLYGRAQQNAYRQWCAVRADAGLRVPELRRQALHARCLTLDHPRTGERVRFEAPLPADMKDLLDVAELECSGS